MVVWYVSVDHGCKEMPSLVTIEPGVLFRYCYHSNWVLEKFSELKMCQTGCPVQGTTLLETAFIQKYGAWSHFPVLCCGGSCFVLTDLNSGENQQKSFQLNVCVWMESYHDITSIDKNCVPRHWTTVYAKLELYIRDYQMVIPRKQR